MKNTLTYKDILGSVAFSTEDEVFYGKLLGMNDLITFEGNTVANLKKAFEEAVDDYLELCTTLGKEPVKHYKGSFNIRIDPSLHQQAAYKSSALGMSLNQFVEQSIAHSLEG